MEHTKKVIIIRSKRNTFICWSMNNNFIRTISFRWTTATANEWRLWTLPFQRSNRRWATSPSSSFNRRRHRLRRRRRSSRSWASRAPKSWKNWNANSNVRSAWTSRSRRFISARKDTLFGTKPKMIGVLNPWLYTPPKKQNEIERKKIDEPIENPLLEIMGCFSINWVGVHSLIKKISRDPLFLCYIYFYFYFLFNFINNFLAYYEDS